MTLLVVAAQCEREGRVLVSRRPEGRALAGFWELPGGKREEGEAPEAALRRELEEELGVSAHDFQISAVLHHQYPRESGGPKEVLILVYRCALSGEPYAKDVAEVRWATPDELRSLRFLEADRDFVAALAERLERLEDGERRA